MGLKIQLVASVFIWPKFRPQNVNCLEKNACKRAVQIYVDSFLKDQNEIDFAFIYFNSDNKQKNARF